MSSKAYSVEERENIRVQLLECAAKLYASQGIKQTTIVDITKAVGISKPFFYKFYPSLQEFIIAVLDFQWHNLNHAIQEVDARPNWDWEQKARATLHAIIHHKENNFVLMSQEEEVWVFKRLDSHIYQSFMDRQLIFFQFLLDWWEIPKGACKPCILANLILSMTIVRNYASESLPFLYTNDLDESAYA